jgi:hypothetical protein
MSNPAFKFDHVHIISQDPEAAAKWYVEIFDATITANRFPQELREHRYFFVGHVKRHPGEMVRVAAAGKIGDLNDRATLFGQRCPNAQRLPADLAPSQGSARAHPDADGAGAPSIARNAGNSGARPFRRGDVLVTAVHDASR